MACLQITGKHTHIHVNVVLLFVEKSVFSNFPQKLLGPVNWRFVLVRDIRINASLRGILIINRKTTIK